MPTDRQQAIHYAALTRQKDASLDAGERYRATLARLLQIPVEHFHGLLSDGHWRDVCRLVAAVHVVNERDQLERVVRLSGLTGNALNRARRDALKLGLVDKQQVGSGPSRDTDRLVARLERAEQLAAEARLLAELRGSPPAWTTTHEHARPRMTTHDHACARVATHEPPDNNARARPPARVRSDTITIDRSIESIGGLSEKIAEIGQKAEEDWRALHAFMDQGWRERIGPLVARLSDTRRRTIADAVEISGNRRDLVTAWVVWTEVLAGELLEERFWEIVEYGVREGRNPFAAMLCSFRREVEQAGHNYHQLAARIKPLIPAWMLRRNQKADPCSS